MRAVNRQVVILAVAGLGLLCGAGIAARRGADGQTGQVGRDGQARRAGQAGQAHGQGVQESQKGQERLRTAAVSDAVAPPQAMRNGHVLQYWPDGTLRSDVNYRQDAYEGVYRTYYASGAPYELRHYTNGHEDGVQQSWTETGVLYLNYEVRNGRRYGLVNASPCNTVGDSSTTSLTGRDRQATQRDQAGFATSDTRNPHTASPAEIDPQAPGADGLPYYDDSTFRPRWSSGSHRVASFTLTTQTGATISDADLRGKPYVASFIYTQCAAVCPILVQQLTRVRSALGRDARIVSFSVTPDTDTPAALARFGKERGIDPREWSLVTGSKHTIYTLARQSYFADDTRVGASPDDVTAFLHTEKLVLVDGDGRLRGVYNGTQPHAVDQLIADIRRLSSVH